MFYAESHKAAAFLQYALRYMYKDDFIVAPKAPVIRPWLIAAVAALWLVSAVGGLWVLWIYENEPGAPTHSPAQWPAETPFRLAADQLTLVALARPQSLWTRASLGERAGKGRLETRQ